MTELEKVNKTLEEIKDVKIYINQAYMKIDLLKKQIEKMKCLLKENNIDCEKM